MQRTPHLESGAQLLCINGPGPIRVHELEAFSQLLLLLLG
jgi:hypothetical protein